MWAFFFEIISKYFLGFDYRRLQYASNFEQENGSKDKLLFRNTQENRGKV